MADVLYGARGGSATTSDLYTIDPVTAAPTPVGPIGYALTALAFDPTTGILYGVTSNNSAANPHSLITIDTATGAGALIGNLGHGSNNCLDIAFAADGTLYGWTTGTGELATIDKATGAATFMGGFTGTFGGGLAFVAFVLYLVSSTNNYSVDPVTGEPTFVSTTTDGNKIEAATYGEGGLYCPDFDGLGTSRLRILDPLTGTITTVGTVFASGAPLDALAWAPPSPPPPPFTGRVQVGSPWRLFITDTDSQTLTLLDKRATQRQFVYTLNGPASSTGLVASDDPEINIPYPDPDSPAYLTNNRRLLYALRREDGASPPYVCRFGGIVMTLEDDSGDSPTSRYTAYDPWQYLMSRPVRNPETLVLPGPGGLTFPAGSRASDIALNLLLATEINDGITHIDLSTDMIVEDTDPLTEPISFEAGLSVGEAWNRLVLTGTIDILLPPLYDPENKPGKVCSLWIGPLAGSVRHNVVMGWDSPPRSLTNISRLVDGTRLANRARYFAGQGGLAVPLESDAASITAYGEWWIQQFFPDAAQNPELVALLAIAEIAIRRNGQRNISFSPAPERSDLVLRDYGLGDFLPVWASKNLREPMQVDYDNPDPSGAGYQRVYQIPVDLDDSGTERVRGIVTVSETTGS